MSSSFSFSRLGKLIRKQFFENARLYTLSVLALFGLMALIFAFWFVTDGPIYSEKATYIIFIMGLFVSGTIFGSMSFNMLGSKDKGIYWLSIPATHLEKLVCTIFYSTIVSTIIYCVVFFIAKNIGISLLEQYIKSHPNMSYVPVTSIGEEMKFVLMNFVYLYFSLQALYILGSVYFPRYSFVLTTVVSTFIAFVFVYYLSKLQDGMLGQVDWELISVKKFDPEVKDSYMLYSISPAVTRFLKYTVQFGIAPLFWVVTWFRLREKQI